MLEPEFSLRAPEARDAEECSQHSFDLWHSLLTSKSEVGCEALSLFWNYGFIGLGSYPVASYSHTWVFERPLVALERRRRVLFRSIVTNNSNFRTNAVKIVWCVIQQLGLHADNENI